MKKIILLAVLVSIFQNVFPIDIFKPYRFSPEELIGKTIVIPTYNGGDNSLHFTFNESVLKTGDFSFSNYSNEKVLGQPIKVLDYCIVNEGKKNECLCLTVEVNRNKVVLCFPMLIKDSDFDGKLIAKLFYGKPKKETLSSKTYSTDCINLKYFLADEINRMEEKFKGKQIYLVGEEYICQKQYVFEGFKFYDKKYEINRRNKEWQFHPITSWKGDVTNNDYNLDVLYAVLKGKEYTVYVKIKENAIKPTDEPCIALNAFDKLVLNETDYKATFANACDADRLKILRDTLLNREFFFNYSKNLSGIKGLYIDSADFSSYKVVPLQEMGNHYIRIDSIVQKKCFDSDNKVLFFFFAIGKGTEEGLFDKYVGLKIDDVVLRELSNGTKHREQAALAEQQRQKQNQERIAELEKKEREYKNMLVRKYGSSNAKLIMNGEVRIGFTKAMCEEAWGEPQYINNTITSHAKWEQWVYGLGTYLYFNGNKLVGIQN